MDPSLYGQRITPPTAQKPPSKFTPRLLLIIGFVIFAILAAFVLIFLNAASNDPTLRQKLSARQTTTLDIIADGQKNLTSDSLKKVNSELNLVLKSDDGELQTALATSGMKKVEKDVAASEAGTETLTSLKNAKLNGQYDTVYSSVITQKLTTLRGLILEVHEQSRSKALKQI
ncbi:MAG: hypothetical protein ABIR46_01405, partial [Candidatus Saccharimonadales bacterium]